MSIERNTKQDKGDVIGVVISVTDYGLGIAKKDRPNLFQPFYKATDAKNLRMNPESNGIGLNISKRIATCLGGDLVLNEHSQVGC